MADFTKAREEFYHQVLLSLNKKGVPFLIGGGLAVREYAPDIGRPMKDMDLFVKAGDYPRIIKFLADEGFETEVWDERWLAKIKKGKHYIDLIFSSHNFMNPVDHTWFDHAKPGKVCDIDIRFIAPEELIWCKAYIQEREHFDGADINHIILHQGKSLDWNRLLTHMENHWDLLMASLIIFRFVYPSKRDQIPKWLMAELLGRMQNQLDNPTPKDKICRGPLLSRTQYKADIEHNHFQIIS